MKILFQTTVNALRQKEQELVKQAWEKLGIPVELKAVQSTVFFAADAGNPDTAAHFYADVEMYTNGPDQPDPSTYFSVWTSSQIAEKANSWSKINWERWANTEYDQLHAQLKTEIDPAKRKDIIIKLNDLLVNDVVIIPLVARAAPVSGRAKDLKGVIPDPWDSEMWNVADWSK